LRDLQRDVAKVMPLYEAARGKGSAGGGAK
jgi:hypothetical protein